MRAGNKEPPIPTLDSKSFDVKDKFIYRVPQHDHAQKALSSQAEYPGSRDQTSLSPSGQEYASGPQEDQDHGHMLPQRPSLEISKPGSRKTTIKAGDGGGRGGEH